MTFKKYCPHCKRVVEGGHGDPFKHLGCPIITCKYCKNPYINSDMVEWSISPFYRKISYYLANNRKWAIFVSLLPVFFAWANYQKITVATVLPFIIVIIICTLYVSNQVKEYNSSASKRITDEYIALLKSLNYPVK